ncbi:MAG TPA: diguanylate cyclase [Micromonosporaceae bacterium]
MTISTVGQLAVPVEFVHGDTTCGDVAALFHARPRLPSVVVAHGERLGVLTRDRFYRLTTDDAVPASSTLADPQVDAAIDWAALRLPASTPLSVAFRVARDRPIEQRYDDLLVDTPTGVAQVPVAQLFDVAAEGFAQQAEHDELTGLTNRGPFIARLTSACADANAGGRRVAVSIVDLDRLKPINDAFGHQLGDAVLVAVARRLSASVGPDDLVARIGGDEFAILSRPAHHVSPDIVADATGDRWRRAVATADPSLGPGTYTSASVGVAVSGTTADARSLLTAADRAMYRAKQAGGNRVVVQSGVEARYASTVLVADDGQPRMMYRPIVRVDTGRVDALLAEARWPRELIGRAVASRASDGADDDRVPAADRWTLHTVCADLLWFDDRLGSAAPASVNVPLSPAALLAAFDDAVIDALADAELPAHRLRLQIPSCADLDVLTSAEARLRRLRRYGVGLALDTVGTGSSCLHALSIVQTSRMRLDPALVAGMVTNPRDHDVVHMLAVLARGIGVEVTATGVDTEDQYTAVVGLGVDLVEGAYVGVPRERGALAELLAGEPCAPSS